MNYGDSMPSYLWGVGVRAMAPRPAIGFRHTALCSHVPMRPVGCRGAAAAVAVLALTLAFLLCHTYGGNGYQ